MNVSNVASATNPYLTSMQSSSVHSKPKHRVDNDGDADDGGSAVNATSASSPSAPEAAEGSILNTLA